jgi:hypothetical protein
MWCSCQYPSSREEKPSSSARPLAWSACSEGLFKLLRSAGSSGTCSTGFSHTDETCEHHFLAPARDSAGKSPQSTQTTQDQRLSSSYTHPHTQVQTQYQLYSDIQNISPTFSRNHSLHYSHTMILICPRGEGPQNWITQNITILGRKKNQTANVFLWHKSWCRTHHLTELSAVTEMLCICSVQKSSLATCGCWALQV